MPGFIPPQGPHNFSEQYFREQNYRRYDVDRGLKGAHEYYIEMRKTGAQSIPASTFTNITGWSATVNDSDMSTSTTGFTIPFDGIWLMSLEYEWSPGTGVQRNTQLRGSTYGIVMHDLLHPGSASTYLGNTLCAPRRLVQGETVSVQVYHDHSAAVTWGGATAYLSCMTATYLRST